MRHAAMAMIVGAALLGGASACGGDARPTAAPGTAVPTDSASTSATASPSPDYRADTKRICDQIDKIFSADLKDFGKELGRMIAYKQAEETTQADQTQSAAQRELAGIADDVRERTSTALDPELKAAGRKAAERIEATAERDEFYQKISTMKDLNGLEAEMRKWFNPLAAFCT